MKSSFAALFLAVFLAQPVFAQEIAPLEEAQKAALKLKAALGTLADAQLAIHADSDQPNLLKVRDERGILFMPDKKLAAAALGDKSAAVVPLGQLWMRNLNLLAGGNAVNAVKLRKVTVGEGDKAMEVILLLAGFARNATGGPELVLYGNDKEPLLRTPLTSIDGVKGSVPVELSGRKAGEGTGLLTVKILGQFEGELIVTTNQ